MPDYEVTCIGKLNLADSHADVTHIGNPTQGWKMTRDEAVRLIDSKIHQFYICDKATNITSWIAVVREGGEDAYLRAHIEGAWNDNLLSLKRYS